MNKTIIPVILSLLLIISCGRNSQPLEEGWKQHTDEKYSVQYPSDWEFDEPDREELIFTIQSPLSSDSDQFRENVSLVFQDLTGMEVTLDQYTVISLNQFKRIISNGKIIESSRYSANGTEFQKVIFLTQQDTGSNKLQVEQRYYLQDKAALILSFACDSSELVNFKETGEKILNSFRLE